MESYGECLRNRKTHSSQQNFDSIIFFAHDGVCKGCPAVLLDPDLRIWDTMVAKSGAPLPNWREASDHLNNGSQVTIRSNIMEYTLLLLLYSNDSRKHFIGMDNM